MFSQLQDKRVLVTGGTGMIGFFVAEMLVNAGAIVTVASFDDVEAPVGAQKIKADLRNLDSCRKVTANQEIVFQVAGIKASARITKSRPASFLVPLLMMNTNLLEAARENGARRIIYTSSIGTYAAAELLREDQYFIGSDPMDTYPGWAKRMGELQVRSYVEEFKSPEFSIIKPSNVYGPRDSFDPDNAMVIGSLMGRCFRESGDIPVRGNGSAIRDLIFAEDVARGIVMSAISIPNQTFNLGAGFGVSIREVVEVLSEVTGRTFFFENNKEPEHAVRILDITFASSILGWKPTVDLRTGLEKTWKWLVDSGSLDEKRLSYF